MCIRVMGVLAWLAASIALGCATAYTANEVGPLPDDYSAQIQAWFTSKRGEGGRMHDITDPVLTSYGWLVCSKFTGKNLFGGDSTLNYFFVLFRGKIQYAAMHHNCYWERRKNRGYWGARLAPPDSWERSAPTSTLAAPGPGPAGAAPAADLAESLERLFDLKERGALSDEEYQRLKRELIEGRR